MAPLGEWECSECGYIAMERRRPSRCSQCGAAADAFDFFEYDDDLGEDEEDAGGAEAGDLILIGDELDDDWEALDAEDGDEEW